MYQKEDVANKAGLLPFPPNDHNQKLLNNSFTITPLHSEAILQGRNHNFAINWCTSWRQNIEHVQFDILPFSKSYMRQSKIGELDHVGS